MHAENGGRGVPLSGSWCLRVPSLIGLLLFGLMLRLRLVNRRMCLLLAAARIYTNKRLQGLTKTEIIPKSAHAINSQLHLL